MTYPSGSTVLRSDIGEGATGLQCTTNRAGCCSTVRAGEFYFPDGTLVPTLGPTPSIRTYYRDRDRGLIRLNRRNNGMETGQFRCEIPDANGTTVNLFINIGMLIKLQTEYRDSKSMLSILTVDVLPTTQPSQLATTSLPADTTPPATTTEQATTPPSSTTPPDTTTEPPTTTSSAATTQPVPTTQSDVMISVPQIAASGTKTAGQTYRLVCSATVTGSTDQPTFTWLDPMDNLVPSGMFTTTGSMSTLTFNPLAVTHAGTYTCEVKAGGVTETQTYHIIVNSKYIV